MLLFFGNQDEKLLVVQAQSELLNSCLQKLNWLFGGLPQLDTQSILHPFVGPHRSLISPWSTNAVEITQNMGISGIQRIETFVAYTPKMHIDPMLLEYYPHLDQDSFLFKKSPSAIILVDHIAKYNQEEGLALRQEEVHYLEKLSDKLGRKLTDSEVFGFSQVNSEHCRHKIFNGSFVIDGEKKKESLFQLIKKTAKKNPNTLVSAYTDNVAFIQGPVVTQFAPVAGDRPSLYTESNFESVISLKAETHNFPTTVEPFNGAATGSGGEIRDRLAGGKGAIPLAGTAVYMTSYPRLQNNRPWENQLKARDWLYQKPVDILIKASNGASDFGNKFGQPLISGSVLTFEHKEVLSSPELESRFLGYDKVIMLAGGIGYGKKDHAQKDIPRPGDDVLVLGGDNYRIGMGGAAVSSTNTGRYGDDIERNAIQRSNPEMQKRVANTIRAMVERSENLISSIHDHGAGGHLNCLSELVENTGGTIELDQLPVGDSTLSAKELIGNESQERMGLVMASKDSETLAHIANRERTPIYKVGEVTGDQMFIIASKTQKCKPIALHIQDLFGNTPKSILNDQQIHRKYEAVSYDMLDFYKDLQQVLQLESVACKDWLTNKVDRSVGGKVAKQQCAGTLQLPLNNCGVMALDFKGKEGVATSIGHAPVATLVNPKSGSIHAIAEALTNIIWAPLKDGLASVSLSANWMWPCNKKGESARLYTAVEAVSDFAIALGINIPTGKDSLSMTQQYSDQEVLSPGTVVISATAACVDITNVIEPVLQKDQGSIYYINFSQMQHELGGSAFAQLKHQLGTAVPSVVDATYFHSQFQAVQELIKKEWIAAGHDIGAGGLITTLLELCFATPNLGANIDLSTIAELDSVSLLFSENVSIVFQAKMNCEAEVEQLLNHKKIQYHQIGKANSSGVLSIKNQNDSFTLDIPTYRKFWYRTSYLLDQKQTKPHIAKTRYENYENQPLDYIFPKQFEGNLYPIRTKKRPKAAVLREKGSNSEREMANAMHLAGFDVMDVHMTDLVSGRETLEEVQFIGAVGGFSNSDVLGAAKGWAGAFRYNTKANQALRNFFSRTDTLSIGICNGCQLFMELKLLYPNHTIHGHLLANDSQKHESAFTSVYIQDNHSVMLSSLSGCKLGVWISHGEGKFRLPMAEDQYNIVAKYGYESYPANPNGSDYNTAILAEESGRHLVTMPHIERSIFPWNWGFYPSIRKDKASPWLEAFWKANQWIVENR